MVGAERTFVVATGPGRVVPYLADLAHSPEWDPYSIDCVRLGPPGPVEVGTLWEHTSTFAGRRAVLQYQLTRFTSQRVVLTGTGPAVTVTDDITVTPEGTGSRVVYRAQIDLRGPARWLTPVLQLVFMMMARRTVARLREVLGTP